MSFFQKLKDKVLGKKDSSHLSGFQKTNATLGTKLRDLKYTFNGVDEGFLEELMVVLLESDVGYETSEKIVDSLKKKADEYYRIDFKFVMELLMEIMHDLYGEAGEDFTYQSDGPTVILFVGVNGSGKTTTCAKFIHKFQQEGKKVAVVAADTFRAGAIEQLARWAEQFGVPCIKGRENGDPSAAIVDGCRYAKENDIDVLLCDTAGRLQNKTHLMNELSKMHRVLQKEIPTAPNAVWLVIDATTGQNGLNQARVFLEATNVTGIILSKMDGTSKGGIVLGIKDSLHIPVEYVTVGEKPEDLKKFDIDEFLYGISEGIRDAD